MNVIELRGIKKVYRNALSTQAPTAAFRLDEFVAREGDRIALVGPSGCGKTTLLNVISGILRPEGGTVLVSGERVDRLPAGRLDRFRGLNVGFVFQEFNLIGALTALENVLLGLRLGRAFPRIQWQARAREMLDRVSLGHLRNARPERLSVGERQRVAIARALVNQPPIVLADEPTGSLDPATAAQVFSVLLDVCDDGTHTLLVVTHDEAIARRLGGRMDCSRLIHESDDRQ